MSDLPPEQKSSRQPFFSRNAFKGVHPVVLGLVGIIIVAHIARIMLPEALQEEVFVRLALVPTFYTTPDTPYQTLFDRFLPLVGHVFLHGGIVHIGFNSLAILDLGKNVARTQGARNFLIVFFLTAIGGAATFILLNPHMDSPAIGASGAACGLFGAYAGEAILRARGPYAQRRRNLVWRAVFWFTVINVGLMAAVRIFGVFPIAWEAHLGGLITGALLAPFTMRKNPAR